MGAHPGLNGQYAILEFPDAADSSVVYIEGVTSDLYLEKANDVQKYSVMYEHLRAQALNVDQSHQFIADIAKDYARWRCPEGPQRRKVPHLTPSAIGMEDTRGICHPVE
jgi:hypothetical protein